MMLLTSNADLEGAAVALVGGAGAFYLLRWLEGIHRNRDEKRGALHGTWYQFIPPHRNEPGKVDLVVCGHDHDILTADISRIEPGGQDTKDWEFSGFVRSDFVFGAFVGKRPDHISYGTIQLLQIDGDLWRGFYCRLYQRPIGRSSSRHDIDTVPLWWTRTNDRSLLSPASLTKHPTYEELEHQAGPGEGGPSSAPSEGAPQMPESEP